MEIQTGMKCAKCGGDVSMVIEFSTNDEFELDYNDLDNPQGPMPGDAPQVSLFCICGVKVLRGQWTIKYHTPDEPLRKDVAPEKKPVDWDDFLRQMRQNMRYPGVDYPDPSIR